MIHYSPLTSPLIADWGCNMNQQKPLKVIAGATDRPLIIGNVEIDCYVLEDETRVLSQRGMARGLGMSPTGSGLRLTNFAASKSINPYISNELRVGIENPVPFLATGGIINGYPAPLLVEMCNVVLTARDDGALTKQQAHIAERCDILIRGLATVGIIALVDEATGYQRIRVQRALAVILENFIAQELQPWTKTFPYEFYEQIFRLKKWDGPDGKKRPAVIGHYTNDIVYARIAPGVLDELRRLNPTNSKGYRRTKHHQWFTPNIGHPKLREHLAAVTALMRAAPNWNRFYGDLQRAFPVQNEQLLLSLDD